MKRNNVYVSCRAKNTVDLIHCGNWLSRSSCTKSGLILLGSFAFPANIISNVRETQFQDRTQSFMLDVDINIFFKRRIRKPDIEKK